MMLRHVARPGTQRTRGMSTATLLSQKAPPAFSSVKFEKEELAKVMAEVPDLKFYHVGLEDPVANPYAKIPMSTPIDVADRVKETIAPAGFKFSKLENGMRIASIDKGGNTANMGLYVNVGSRDETADTQGLCHMLESMAFHSTAHLSHLRTIKTVESLGATASCSAGREHMVYSAECLRKYMPIMVPILTGNVLFPRFLPWEVEANKAKLASGRKKVEETPDQFVSELLNTAAYHNNTLGLRLQSTDRSPFDGDLMRQFMLNHFSPDQMVFVGVNVDHQELCKWLMRSFVDYNAIPPTKRTPTTPVYTGGDVRVEASGPFSHLAIGYHIEGGWNGPDLVPVTPADIEKAVDRFLASPPTVVVHGDLSQFPHSTTVAARLQAAAKKL